MLALAVPSIATTAPEVAAPTTEARIAALESRIQTLELEVSSLTRQLEGQTAAAEPSEADETNRAAFWNAAQAADQQRRLGDLEAQQRTRNIRGY
jgi:hypothetical protein